MTTSKGFFRALQGVVVGGLAAWSISTLALNTEFDRDDRVIPYTGTLERNGEAYTGTVDLRVILSSEALSADGGVGTSTNYTTEQHDDITVYGGKFSIRIGSKTTGGIPDSVFNQDRLYLSIQVRDGAGTGTTGFVTLTGKQRIYPTPFSYWAAEGNNFTTDSNTVTFGGADLVLGTADGRPQTTAASGGKLLQRALVHSVTGDQLHINYAYDFEGGTTIGGPTRNDGDLSVAGGNLSMNSGNLTISSGNLTLSSGLLSVTGSSVTPLTLTSTGSYVELKMIKPNGLWNLGIGAGGAGSNDFYFYNAASNFSPLKITATGHIQVQSDVQAPNNKWGSSGTTGTANGCRFEGGTHGSTQNQETLFGYCTDGYFVAGYRRYHGDWDYGIEDLELYCCPL